MGSRRTQRWWSVVGLLTSLSGALAAPAPARAVPWVEVSEAQLREDVELLKTAGILRGPVISWPQGMDQLCKLLPHDADELPAHVLVARERVLARCARAAQRVGAEVRADVTNEPDLVRDFGSGARAPVDVSSSARLQGRGGFARVSASYRAPQAGSDLSLERSLLGYALGGVHAYAGYPELWWGPSSQGSLLLSGSARPFPRAGFRRMRTEPFKSKWLSWLGPYRVEAFVGVLDEKRDAKNALLVGMRVEFEPVHNWEIGVTRVIQLCGRGRPCTRDTWGRALVGVGDVENVLGANEPGNQLAGIDMRASARLGAYQASLYAQALAEDEGRFTIYRFAQQWGATLSGALGARGASFKLTLEYTDTRAKDYLVAGAIQPGNTYTHLIYHDGYSYRGRPIGFSLDGDARFAHVSWSVTDLDARRFFAAARFVELNAFEHPGYHVSANRETVWLGELGAELPFAWGSLRFEGRLQKDAPNTPASSPWKAQIESGYRLTF